MNLSFYAVIIGTEILNGRREDKHFDFLKKELLKRGLKFKSSFIIEDDPELIEECFSLIKKDKNSIMFSFGGIGATPDDYTRKIAADVFTNSIIEENLEAKKLIVSQFKEKAFPHRIKMALLPKGAKLLNNPINKVPGFYLEERFFFMPGFPQMAHPMATYVLEKFFPKRNIYRFTLCIKASENDLMDIMKQIPKEVDFSSLPSIKNGIYSDTISIASEKEALAKKWIEFFEKEIKKRGFSYTKGADCL